MPGALKSRSKSESALRNGMANPRAIHTCTVCVLARNLRTAVTPIQTKELSNMLRSHTGKRRTHRATIICYEDHMEFKRKNFISRKAFRSHLFYRDIVVPYRCVEYPNIFMLSVRENGGKATYYETYKCKNLADAEKIGNIILNATSSSAKVYRDTPLTSSHQSLRDSAKRFNSLPQLTKQTSMESLNHGTPIRDRSSSSERSWSSPRRSSRHSSPAESLRLANFTESVPVEKIQLVQMSKYKETKVNEDGTTTYFEYDPIHGADFNEKGPIYMFLQRFPSMQFD